MYWTGLRENGLTTSFEMEKVAAPPAAFSKYHHHSTSKRGKILIPVALIGGL
jgi:hypothetical protein